MPLEEIREERKLKVNRIKKYFNILMSVLYILAAILLFNIELNNLSTLTKNIVAGILLSYGLFRLYRGIKYE